MTHIDWLKAFMEDDEDASELVRELLIDGREDPYQVCGGNVIASDALRHINELPREDLTALALSLSLCPLHLVDYAICFEGSEDGDPECAAIRTIHPSHDT